MPASSVQLLELTLTAMLLAVAVSIPAAVWAALRRGTVFDRLMMATTVLAAIDPATRSADLARPGHVFPLRARRGGVLVRAGQTEASVDLARIAGLYPSGVICEIMNDDGTMARLPQLAEFCGEHGLKLLTVAELIRYRMRHERYVRRVAETVLPTRYGDFRMIVFASDVDREQHVALIRGNLTGPPPLVRVHSHCLTGDVFGSTACDCYEIVARSLAAIAREDRGVFVYLHQTCRGFAIEQPSSARPPNLSYPSCTMIRRAQPDAHRAAAEVPRNSGQPLHPGRRTVQSLMMYSAAR